MLFDLTADPFEQHNVAADHPEVVEHALSLLHEWGVDALRQSPTGVDPLWTVLHEGGPWHSRVDVEWYLDRLEGTGRGGWADHFRQTGPPTATVSDQTFLNPSTPSEFR